ncbi:InlB B-repeat-containing protein [Anaerococcus sp. NML200537]|uniref:InlB B-repeat-containing protein n=1 Tax=Anaerococcus sp. NML200537 TaxID=2954485 RepID=UPI0022384E65|nr:InlB B-repeat-containing protein [Anaerococcus sp. NML200537]
MKKYQKAKILLESKAQNINKKPIYATRKLSIGLVSCMLGLVMAMPVAHAEEFDMSSIDSIIESLEDDPSPDDSSTNDSNDVEDILTYDEIQSIRNRTNSLKNDYFFNDNMVEELKAELRKAKADPSVNYEQAKASLIDEAIQKNTPAQKAPGEVRAAVKAPKEPSINPVSPGAKIISGGGLIGANQRKKAGVDCVIRVTVKNGNTVIETKTFTIKSTEKGSTWSVNLDNPVQAGYTVTAVQEFNGGTSTPKTVVVEKTSADKYGPKIKNENITVYTEDKWTVSIDETQEIIDKFKANNKGIVDFDKYVTSIVYNKDRKNNKKTITLSFTDKSSYVVDVTDTLTLTEATEVSKAPTVKDITVVDKQIEVTLADPFVEGTKIAIRFKVLGEGLTEGQCAPDKRSTTTPYITASGNKFIYQIPDGQKIDFDDFIEIKVKEPDKKSICSIKRVKLTHPKLTEVKDPKILTEQDKKNIDAAIRAANTVNGESKLPNGTGDWDGTPAFIEFDKNGNARIINPSNINGDWINYEIFNPHKKADGSLDVKDESKVITFPAKDLVKNIGPDAPTIKESDDKKSITVKPITDPADTDIIEHTITYTGTDGLEKKIVAKHDLKNKTWTISEGSEFADIDSNTGLITIDKLKIKNETEVKALVQDNGEYVENSDKKYSPESKLKVTKTKADQVTELGGLDPVEIRKWVGEDIDWSKGIKVKKDENKDSINKLLEGATITDATDKKRNTDKEGDFVGKISVKFDDGSELIVDNQYLYVSNHVTSIKRDKTPTDALEVEFKLGEGTKVDNTSGGAIEGNKDNPISYSKYKVKPGTNLKEYKLPGLNSSVIDNINLSAQKGYTQPVWKDKDKGTNFVASTDNKVFTATATKTYDVTLQGNNGKEEVEKDKVETFKTGETYTLPEGNTFTPPENQEFSGWKIGDDTELKQPGDEITVDGDKVIKAIWKPIEFKVTFKTEKGATGSMDPVTVKKGDEYVIPKPTFTPDKNKEFAGWKIKGQEGLKKAEEKTEKISGDVTLIATWKDIMVKVSYKPGNGSGSMDGAELVKGSTYKLLANKFTAPANKKFKGWKIGEKEYAPDAEITVNEDTVVEAVWEDIEYKVTFNKNGGSGDMLEKKAKKGSEFELPGNGFEAPKNQKFSHWKIGNEDKNPGDKITIDGDTEITAVWEDIKVKVSYKPGNGSGSMDGAELVKGSTYKLLANKFTAPANKKFAGWKIGDKDYAAGDEITVDKDTTITAVWEDIETTPPAKEEVQVSYAPGEGSGTMDGAKLEKGSKYTLSANGFTAPDKKKFKGWKIGDKDYAAGDEITVDKDITVTAVWEDITTEPGKPEPGKPEPGKPEPGTPDPGTPDPGTPDPGTPDPGTPDPGTPDPGTPDPGTPDPGTPEPGKPDPGKPEPGKPEPGKPEPGKPEPGKPDPGTPDPGTPDPGKPDPGTPDPGTPDPGTPDPGTPEPGKPEPGKPEPGKPEPGNPEPGKPEPGKPEPGKPEPSNPNPGTPGIGDNPGGTTPGEITPTPGTPDDKPNIPESPEETNPKTPSSDESKVPEEKNPDNPETKDPDKTNANDPSETKAEDPKLKEESSKLDGKKNKANNSIKIPKTNRPNVKTGVESVAGIVCTLVGSTGALYISRKKED